VRKISILLLVETYFISQSVHTL